MAKEILLNKLIINLENNEVLIHYKLKINNVIDNKKFYTANVTAGIDGNKIVDVIASAVNKLNLIEGV